MLKRYFNLEKIFFTNPGQLNIAPLLFFVGIMIFSLVIAVNIQKFSPLMVLAVVAGLAVAVITLVNTDFALIILIFSMLWSPEIPIAGTPERAVTIRIDDFMIMAVFFTWLAKMAIIRQESLIRYTPLNKPIFAYLGIHAASTSLGVMLGTASFKQSIFYLLKYCEYFMIYFLFVNNLRDMRQVKLFITLFLLSSFFIGIFADRQIGIVDRPSAPFEGEHGEPNTLGGYLMFTMALAAGLFLNTPLSVSKILLGGLFCANIYPLLMTLSRSSYLGLSAAMAALMIFTKKGKVFLISVFIFSVLFLPILAPETVKRRVAYTFESQKTYEIAGAQVTLEKSAAARVEDYHIVMKKIAQRPFFGCGILGAGFIDPQYPRLLAEVGFIGFFIFIWLAISMLVNSWKVYASDFDDFSNGLALGLFGAMFGILILGFGSSPFVIVRISEPMWFVVAVVMMLPQIRGEENVQEQE